MSKKFYVSNVEELNEYEKKNSKVSYARLCDRVFGNMVLCNNIANVDETLFDNIICGDVCEYVDSEGNYYTREEFGNDEKSKIEEQPIDIYQYYIVNLNFDEEYIKEHFNDNLLLFYSEKLEVYVLGVTHFGTGWDYVLTDLEPTTDYKEI